MLSENYMLQGSKGGEEEAHTPVETPNNLLSVAYAKVLIAVAEGELAGNPTGRDIFLNGTPLISSTGDENFGGVTWEWRKGTVEQTYIQGIPEVSNELSVGVEVKAVTPWVQQITKTELSAARITLQWPALQQQLANGDTVGYTIDYAVDIATDGGSFELYQQFQVSGKTNGVYERTHRVNLPRADVGWTLRVRRITPNNESSLIQDTMNLKSYAEVVDAKQRYPNTALLFVQFDSRLFGGGSIPKISVKTQGRIVRMPSNYDPEARTYSGVWDGSFKWGYTNNPAWVFFDIVTQDRFGLGSRVTVNQVDKWELYEVAQYCDVMVDNGDGSGKLEPRHTCNIYIQSKTDAWQVLRDICSIFNGMTYWNGNQFVALADKLEPIDNIPTFSRSNVIKGEFQYSSTDERTIYTSALVSYDDPDDHFETQVEAVWEKSEILRWGGDRQTSLSAIGCTSRGEAQRKGKYTLITNMLNRSVTFKTGLQGLNENVLPGSIIGVADPIIAGKPFTGRLVASTPTVVTLDRDTEAKAGDLLFVNLKDGSQQARTVRQVSGRVVTVTTAYSEALPANAVWYLEAEDLKSQLFKVIKVTSPDESIYEINAVEYNTSKYAAIDNGARLEPRPISKVPPSVQKSPSPITISSSFFLEQTMAVPTMTISWPATENSVLYEGEWRLGQGDWVTLGTTGATEFTVRGIYSGKYLARVRAINALGIKSLWGLSATTDIAGKTGVPPAITSLTVTPIVFGMVLNWTFPEGAEDTARTEVMYSVSPNFGSAIKLGDFAYPQQVHEINGLAAGVTRFFWARLVDRSGNVGPYFPLTSQNGIMGQSSTDVLEYEKYFLGQINNSALGQELAERIDLIDGPPSLAGSVNERINEVNEQVDAIQADLQEQIDNIADLADSMPYDPTKTYIAGQAVLGSDGKLYQAKQAVPVTTPPPNTTYWTDIGQAVITADGLAARVTTVETTVTNQQGLIEAQSTRIDGVTASLNDKASVTSVNTLSGRVTEAEGKITTQGQAITGVQTSLAGKADVTTVTALTNTVTQQGNDIVANGQAITNVTASLGDTGGENLLFNPSFDVMDSSSTTMAAGWSVAGTGITPTISVVPSTLDPKGQAQRIVVGGTLSPTVYVDTTPKAANYPSAGAGQFYTFSIYWKSTAGLGAKLYIQSRDTSGTLLRTDESVGFVATGAWQRISYTTPTALPANTTEVRLIARLTSSSATSGNCEWDRAQLQVGKLATGWQDSNATLAADVKANASATTALTGTVTQQGNNITALGSQVTAVKAQVDDPATGLIANANGLTSLRSTVTTLDGKVTATSEKVDGVSAWVTAESAGDESGSAGDSRASAGATSIMSVIAERDFVLAQRTDQVEVSLGNSNARITDTITAQADINSATASRVNTLIANTDANTAAIRSEETARTNADGALASQITTVQAVANRADTTATQANASVQTVATAQAATDGKINATWAVKLQVNSQGQYVAAGFGIGIENNGTTGLSSTFLVTADKFAIVNGVNTTQSAPFVVNNGQVFIKDAFIANGSITMLKIGDTLQSDNYVAGQTGWRLLKNGSFEINGNVAGQGRMTMTNRSLRVYDGNNIKRVQLGDLSE